MSGGWIGKSGAPGNYVVQSGVFSLAEVNEAKLRKAWYVKYSETVKSYAPTALYMMEESSGTQMTDTSGNANHGTYVGSVLPTSPSLIAEGALSLDVTSTQYATAPGAVAASLSGFSIASWLKFSHGANTVIIERNGNTGYSLQTGAGAAGIPSGSIAVVSNGSIAILVSSIAINDGLPHSVVVVIGATAAASYIFIDGVDRTTRPNGNASPSYGSSTNWYLGSRAGAGGFNGRMDGVAFIPSLLTLDDAKNLNISGSIG